jgi:hypothetical protein
MEPSATYNPQPQPLRSTEKHQELMKVLWLRMGQAFGASIWEAKHGPSGGPRFAEWSVRLEQYTGDQIARGVGNCQQWQATEPPTLNEFCSLCLTELRSNAPTQPSAPAKDHTIRDREQARQRQLQTSSRSRKSDEVESFMTAYHNLGLGARWPGGKVAL